MPQHLAQDAAIPTADDEHALRLAMGEQRHVRHHLVVDELVPRRELNHAIQHHHPAEIFVLEDNQLLMVRLAVEKDLVRLQVDAETFMECFFDPAVHRSSSLPRSSVLTTTLSGENARFITSMVAFGSAAPHMNTSSAA